MSKQEAVKLVKRYRKCIEAEGVLVSKAILFGSQAKGTSNEWSDVDICIVSPSFGKDLHAERVKLMHLRYSVSDLIEPHPYTQEQLEDPYDPLAAEIRNTGVVV